MPVATEQYTAEETSRFIDLGDYRAHYHEAGVGETVIMLHGGGAGASAWSNFRLNLGPFAERYRTILLDQVGFGQSGKPLLDEPLDKFNATAIKDLLDALGIEKAHLVGNSMGGSTALRTAVEYPDRIDKMVMMGVPAGIATTSPMPTEGQKVLFSFYNDEGPSQAKLRAIFNIMLYDTSMITDELISTRYAMATDADTLAFHRYQRTRQVPTHQSVSAIWRELDKIKHKTLLVWGREDRVLPIDHALFMLQQLQDAELHIFTRCGHWAQVEKANEFNELVLGFLARP